MEIKRAYGGKVTETKEHTRNGVPVGIVAGHIGTWDLDRGDWSGVKDQFVKGAFTESIERHQKTNRPIRLKDHHGATIGGFPIDTVKQDDVGLYGVGEINLDTQAGREIFALAKQGVLSDFSIGWSKGEGSTVADGVRTIPKAEVWEGSIVDEPMNPHANILTVKTASFDDFEEIDIRGLEKALKCGITFTNGQAKKLISLMKTANMLRDEQGDRRDGVLSGKLEELSKLFKET